MEALAIPSHMSLTAALKTVLATTAGSAFAAFASIGAASAMTLFDGGSPDQINGNEMSQWVQTEDFVLDAAIGTTISGASFWTFEGGTWDGTLEYYLFADAGGQPASSPFAQGTGTNVTRTSTGNLVLGIYPEYFYSFDFPALISLSENTTYWLGLHLSSNFDRDEIFWGTTGAGFSPFGQESQFGTFDNWLDNGENHAFYLTGEPAVPVPAPLPILGVFAAFRFSRKLKRRIKASKSYMSDSTSVQSRK